ncbi:hypothetical protein, partial [Frankia sp. CeD]|uniref:hypothetical protein n=1 Tax=Frankia sp. CeD TaxID=258230 RepID=UPI001F34E13B
MYDDLRQLCRSRSYSPLVGHRYKDLAVSWRSTSQVNKLMPATRRTTLIRWTSFRTDDDAISPAALL